MSFNIDDPLAGILSDGSDDSFFDDDILGKKKPAKKKGTPTAEKKNALFDLEETEKPKNTIDSKKNSLFEIGTDAKKIPLDDPKFANTKSPSIMRTVSNNSFKSIDTRPKTVSDKIDATIKSSGKTKVSASADKLDSILNDFSSDLKKEVTPTEKGKSSQSLLDDILGGSTSKAGSGQAARPVTAVKSQDFDLDSFLGKSDSKQTIGSSKSIPQKPSVKIDKPKEEVAQPKKKSSENWLGLFQEDEDISEGDNSGMPSWLVGGDTKKKKSEKKVPKELPPDQDKVKEDEEIVEKEKEPNVDINAEPNLDQLTKAVSSNILQSSNEDITAEGAALYLQQQESQLMVALQLKAQEEKLAVMQMRQKETQRVQREAALAHHSQLDAMLRRQADNRQQMQAIITAHQERISQRIRALLTTQNIENEDVVNATNEYESTGVEQKESPHIKEKKQLLQLVQSLQENHDKEIDLMETSYRRQLAFLEVSINQADERMKDESEKLDKYYTEKIHWLEEHHLLYKKMTEDNMNSLSERHKAENEMLRQQHLENVKVLQEHHAALMENIKNAVKQEHALIQDSVGFSSDLHELVIDVKENKSQCQKLVEKVTALTENTQRDTEKSLQARETQINDMLQQLKKERDNFESEKTESRDLVKMLETRLKQMITMIEDDTASLKQKKMEFDFEKATFNKQTEFAKNILKKQDEEIKMMKDDIQKEYQDKIEKINEEKTKAIKDSAAIAKEKSTVQSLKQELEKIKAELQAQLEEVTEERSKLNVEKQQMHMEEQRIVAKSRDLDLLAKTAIEKQSQADKKYSEAEFIQRKYEERIRRIQEHVVTLNSREKHIAKEKVALSRERLTLHNEKKQIEGTQQCSLCKSQNVAQYYEPTYTLPDPFLNLSVSRDYRQTNVSTAMNAIEQEMSHLMGRSFSLRHSTEIGNVNFNSREDKFVDNVDDNLHTSEGIHAESGTFKEYMDPKFMMLRLDVQKVLSNLDQTKKHDIEKADQVDEED